MTKENSKRLYEHYVKDGNVEAAENMLAKYPEFKEKPKEEAPKAKPKE